jgi:ABC-type uncharacterized transport system involved in gliding motility auxiliary subunit
MTLDRREVGKFFGILGVALLFAGYLLYSIQSEFLLLHKVLLIVGGVFALGGIVLGFRGVLRFFSKRSSQLGTNTTLLTLGVLILLVIVNVLGYKHQKTFDLTTQKLFTLSDQTKKIVDGLKTDINIVRFSKTPDQQFDDLMSEYRRLSSHVKYQNVDPQAKPEVAQQYGATHIGDIVVASGPRKQTLAQNPGQPTSESDVTSAILKVTTDHVKTVCFVTGHDEKSLTDTSATGYSLVDAGLKKEDYATNSINLVSQNGVPATCNVLVIAGPTQSFFPQEAAMVSKYLDAGGKVLFLDDPQTDAKLDDILTAWNITAGKNIVADASGVGRLFGTGPAVPLVVNYGESPITKNLTRGMTFFPLARTVSITDKRKPEPQAVELLLTSPRSFTIPNLEQKEVRFDPKTDTAGPLSLGVAANKAVGEQDARLVVIGDSDFAANQWVGLQHDGDLFYNSIDWLAQDENLISIRPKEATDRQLVLTESQEAAMQWITLVFLPGIVLFAGAVIWWKRR